MSKFKPMLPCDWYQEKVKFPCLIQPKIDGVHALVREETLFNRTMKKVPNSKLSEDFSKKEFNGICGEIIVGKNRTADDLCRKTTSMVNTIDGDNDSLFNIFDYIPNEDVEKLPYLERISKIPNHILLNDKFRLVLTHEVDDMEELLEWEELFLQKGYEGLIIRDPQAPYKRGRCGKTNMACWRVKRMIEEEILVTGIVEGKTNLNDAKTNELGRTERSTHKGNMIPNGMVGSIIGTLIKDVKDPITGKLLFNKGMEITVSPGKMSAEERRYYFVNQDKIIGEYVKFKLFPKGIKDKPRFPVYITIRPKEDVIL